MRWTVHGERTLYESDWLRLALVDVELPSGDRYEHHVVRIPQPAAATVVRQDGEILLLWRHRFITDRWGWEVPAGEIHEGEQPEDAAVRETLEETGWRPGPLKALGSYFPMNGRSDQLFHVFLADAAERIGEPTDPDEAERVEWLPETSIRELLRDGSISDGYSLVALYRALSP